MHSATKIRLKVQEGTRSNGKRLCDTCTSGVVMRGSAESEEMIYCHEMGEPVPLRVVECNRYIDRSLPTLSAMREIAWILRTEKNGRQIGFAPPKNRDSVYYGALDDDD